MTTPAHQCTAACAAMPVCIACKRSKKPRGRDSAIAEANGYCDYECIGYMLEPIAGHLWPGELVRAQAVKP